MILRGKQVDGERAAQWGMINEVVDDDALDDAVEAVVQEFASAATVSVGLAKQLMFRNLSGDLNGALEQEGLAEELAVRSDDFKEGMRAFVQRRDPDYQGR
jgi:2-(1,2-epoxy-1,2-dihydrophenyl)acetyl-CoA isomerase